MIFPTIYKVACLHGCDLDTHEEMLVFNKLSQHTLINLCGEVIVYQEPLYLATIYQNSVENVLLVK